MAPIEPIKVPKHTKIEGSEEVSRSTGNPGLDSVVGTGRSDVSSSVPNNRGVLGQSSDSVSLEDVIGVEREIRLEVEHEPEEVAPEKPSPFSGDKTAIGPNAPKINADKKLPEDWATRMHKHAKGTSGRFNVGAHQTAIRGMMRDFANKAAENPGAKQGDMRSLELAKQLHTALNTAYTAEQGVSQGAGELRQAHMVLAAVVEHARSEDTPTTKLDLMLAVMTLKPEDQKKLFEADLAGGKQLTGILYEAMTEAEGPDQAVAKSLFNAFKAASNQAYVTLTLDRADPTGQSTQVFNDFVEHMGELGISGKTQEALANHLAFQIKLGDFKAPDTTKPGWKQDFTAELVSRFAALEERTGAELTKMLDLPKADLLHVMGHAMANKREGDVHIVRVIRDNFTAFKEKMGEADGPRFDRIFHGLNTGALDAQLFLTELKAGSDMRTIEGKLSTKLGGQVTELTNELNRKATGYSEKALDRILYLNEAKWGDPRTMKPPATGDKLKEINAEISTLTKFIGEMNPKIAEERILKLTQEKTGDPTPSPERLEQIKGQLEFLADMQEDFAKLTNTKLVFTESNVGKLVERFGVEAVQRVRMTSERVENDAFRGTFKLTIDSLSQLRFHIEAQDNPEHYKAGLENFSPVMPTAGKTLEDFHHIDSMVQGLVSVTDEIRRKDGEFSLANNPIIIIDQSDGDGTNEARVAKWNQNHEYLESLNEKYGESHGLNIVHVKMQDISRMIEGSGIEKLFDTTGQNFAGYGGARNMAFLLGPVIRDAILKGQSLDTITPENLIEKIKANALGEEAPKLFMGDDTDYLGPGAMFAKVGMNGLYKDEYYTATSRRDGRDTTNVNSGIGRNAADNIGRYGTDGLVSSFGGSGWNKRLVQPGMGSVIGAPKFCYDVPNGAEEKHHTALNTYTDQLGTVRHLSGDRMRPMPGQVNGYLNYGMGTEAYQMFGNSDAVSWNQEHLAQLKLGEAGFQSLGEVLENVTDPEKLKQNTLISLTRAGMWLRAGDKPYGVAPMEQEKIDNITRYLEEHPDLDSESKAELLAVKATYENAQRQTGLLKSLIGDLLHNIVPDVVDENGKITRTEEQISGNISEEKVLNDALALAVEEGVDIAKALTDAKGSALDGVDLNAGNNQILRNVYLMLESVTAGGFAKLAEKLV